jgi:hypothetical protein
VFQGLSGNKLGFHWETCGPRKIKKYHNRSVWQALLWIYAHIQHTYTKIGYLTSRGAKHWARFTKFNRDLDDMCWVAFDLTDQPWSEFAGARCLGSFGYLAVAAPLEMCNLPIHTYFGEEAEISSCFSNQPLYCMCFWPLLQPVVVFEIVLFPAPLEGDTLNAHMCIVSAGLVHFISFVASYNVRTHADNFRRGFIQYMPLGSQPVSCCWAFHPHKKMLNDCYSPTCKPQSRTALWGYNKRVPRESITWPWNAMIWQQKLGSFEQHKLRSFMHYMHLYFWAYAILCNRFQKSAYMNICMQTYLHTLDKKWIIEVIRWELNPLTCNWIRNNDLK